MDILLKAEEAQQVFLNAAHEIAGLAKMIHDSNQLKHFIHVVGYKSPYSDQDNDSKQHSDHDHKEPPYEKMKFDADLFIRQTLRTWGIPLSVVNPSVVIGDSYTGITEQLGGLGILVDAVRRNLMALTPGGKDYWLPLVHVDHVAALISALTEEENPTNNTYFLLDNKINSPNIIELIQLISKEVRVNGPLGSVPYRLIKKLLNLGVGRLLQLPKESLDFIVTTEFPTTSKLAIEKKHNLNLSISKSTLPFVISDLDYRISHGTTHAGTTHASHQFQFNRRANLATIESEGKGTPILILHGTFSTSFNLLPMAQQLSKLGNPIYLVDLPGFGRSPFHHNHSIMKGFEQSIVDLIRGLESKVIIVGHSFGGYLAAKMAETLQDRIEKVILLQPVLHPVSSVYKSSLLTRTILRFMSKAALKKNMLNAKSFNNQEEIPEDYILYMYNELKSSRVRKTTAEVMSALSKSNNIKLNPSSWDYDKVSIVWGTKDTKSDIPNPFRNFSITHLPYAHQFPISHPEAAAHWISKLINK
ncbi:pimeloyl-ACP methyl ester carboxylesterase [Paenibacillus baekrokdamisoli]|nr:pimeloyl-ACP methyl ester carboxylesterase [Paenibacillus baekrokdamisoli]